MLRIENVEISKPFPWNFRPCMHTRGIILLLGVLKWGGNPIILISWSGNIKPGLPQQIPSYHGFCTLWCIYGIKLFIVVIQALCAFPRTMGVSRWPWPPQREGYSSQPTHEHGQCGYILWECSIVLKTHLIQLFIWSRAACPQTLQFYNTISTNMHFWMVSQNHWNAVNNSDY